MKYLFTFFLILFLCSSGHANSFHSRVTTYTITTIKEDMVKGNVMIGEHQATNLRRKVKIENLGDPINIVCFNETEKGAPSSYIRIRYQSTDGIKDEQLNINHGDCKNAQQWILGNSGKLSINYSNSMSDKRVLSIYIVERLQSLDITRE